MLFVAPISLLHCSSAIVCWHFKANSIHEDQGTKIRDAVELSVWVLFRGEALEKKSAYCLGISLAPDV